MSGSPSVGNFQSLDVGPVGALSSRHGSIPRLPSALRRISRRSSSIPSPLCAETGSTAPCSSSSRRRAAARSPRAAGGPTWSPRRATARRALRGTRDISRSGAAVRHARIHQSQRERHRGRSAEARRQLRASARAPPARRGRNPLRAGRRTETHLRFHRSRSLWSCPGVFPTRAAPRPSSRFNRLDFPTFDRPTKATTGAGVSGKVLRAGGPATTTRPRPSRALPPGPSFQTAAARGLGTPADPVTGRSGRRACLVRDGASLGRRLAIRRQARRGRGNSFQGDPDHLVHVRDEVELHLVADLLGQIVQVLVVLGRRMIVRMPAR